MKTQNIRNGCGTTNEKLKELSKSELIAYIEDLAKNWLAHDGLWFLSAEKKYGMEKAIELDRDAWEIFTTIEAKRIMKRFGIKEGGGLEALKKALNFRFYANINEQKITDIHERSFTFEMNECRVQGARKRKGLPDFPCKSVGIVEYGNFAKTIDPRIKTECIACPPDKHPDTYWCKWKFTIEKDE